MQRPSDQLLPCPTFTLDQHRSLCLGNLRSVGSCSGFALAEQLVLALLILIETEVLVYLKNVRNFSAFLSATSIWSFENGFIR